MRPTAMFIDLNFIKKWSPTLLQALKMAHSVLPAVLKSMEDKDGTVRDSALHCMGILKGRLTESVTAKYLKDVNK